MQLQEFPSHRLPTRLQPKDLLGENLVRFLRAVEEMGSSGSLSILLRILPLLRTKCSFVSGAGPEPHLLSEDRHTHSLPYRFPEHTPTNTNSRARPLPGPQSLTGGPTRPRTPFPFRETSLTPLLPRLREPHPLPTPKTSGRATVVQHPASKHLRDPARLLFPLKAARPRHQANSPGSLPNRRGEPRSSGGRGASTR